MISEDLLAKFKKLYQEQFNIALTDEEATAMATDLVNLMKVLLKPQPKQQKDNIKPLPKERRNHETNQTQIYQ